jgi:hypothetical protein
MDYKACLQCPAFGAVVDLLVVFKLKVSNLAFQTSKSMKQLGIHS